MLSKFPQKLRELRLEKELTQRQLADALGVTNQNISDWENGKAETNFDMLITLAGFFAVSVDELLGAEPW